MLYGIPPAPAGYAQLSATFDIDVNGILTVSATDTGSGNSAQITITYGDESSLTVDEIERMLSDADKFAEHDRKLKENRLMRNELERVAYFLSDYVDNNSDVIRTLSTEERDEIRSAVSRELKWITDHPDENKVAYETRLTNLRRLVKQYARDEL